MEKNQEIQLRLSRAWNETMGSSQRRRIQEVWKKTKEKKELSPEDKRLAKILQEHNEYHKIWESVPASPNRSAGEQNPYLHVYLHLAIENQIAEENPRQVNRYISRRISQGVDRHNAIHEVVAIFSEYLFDALRYRKPFDRLSYIQKLSEMSEKIT
ncbi:hypothetical protein DRJ04_02900 [Candidatus Aerophobetes bacterium]|uniref:DUF1841 family protein n=1 Tax=Aerophobetes bacterium TaxID=2030807 RepID=A0A662DI19_UNCAE|nr:MAG: hypothetical protein DRJ04_02900 [Candidatus Aerophobetes bacterium]